MAKATIVRPSGLEITVDGTPAEIDEVVRRLEGPVGRAPALPPAPRKSAGNSGPRLWLEEMISIGFFESPRGQRSILDKLAENGHHLRDSDITQQLVRMVREKRLRRSKVVSDKGARKVWGYSKW